MLLLVTSTSAPLWAITVPANPYLADVHNNQGHWNDAQTDHVDLPVPKGHYEMTDEGYRIVYSDAWGVPAYTANVKGQRVHWFFAGFSMRKLIWADGQFTQVDRLDLPPPDAMGAFEFLDDETRIQQRAAVQDILDRDDPDDIESALADYLRTTPNRMLSAVEDQVQHGILYSLFTKDHGLIGSNSRGLIRIDQTDPTDPYSKLKPAYKVTLPDRLFNNERVQANTIFPTDVVFGLAMSFNGYVVINTLGGKLVTLDRNTFAVVDVHETQREGELYTNSFATSHELDGGAIYVASNKAMYRLAVLEDGTISDAPKHGAWSAEYDIGVSLPFGKIADGTGATPTLMGFGPNEDKLVVITDGARKMRLVAFWRDEIPAGWQAPKGAKSNRIADQAQVDIGTSDTVQSEQSVVVSGDYAFVVNGVFSGKSKPYLTRGSFYRGFLVGTTRIPPTGAAMFKWRSDKHGWQPVWSRSDIGVLATVPFISTPSHMVVVNGYFADRLKQNYHLGLDLDTGEAVMSIESGTDPAFNGTFTGVKCDFDGTLMYTTLFGLVRFDVDKMDLVASPERREPFK